MAEQLTQREKEMFYDQSTGVDEFDPGLEAFGDAMRTAERFLNENGGSASYSYGGTLYELNDKWENHDQSARLVGKLYVMEASMVELARGEWSGPFRDEEGTYFLVDGAELVSQGVIDAKAYEPGTVNKDGMLERQVCLAYAFSTEDMESDIPMFYARPDDVLQAQYELPTYDAVRSRLFHHWPKQMEQIERRIDLAGRDPQKQVDLLSQLMQKDIHQRACLDFDDYANMLAHYLYVELEHDKQWPYVVQLEGQVSQLDDEGDILPINIDNPLTVHMKVIGMDVLRMRADKGAVVEIGIVFALPNPRDDEEEGGDMKLITPLSSIQAIRSSRPNQSFLELLEHGAGADIPEQDGAIEAAYADSYEELTVPRHMVEFRRLERLDQLLNQMSAQTRELRRHRFTDREAALEATHVLTKSFFEQMNQLGLEDSDTIRVSGHGIVKGNVNLTTALGKFHLDIDPEQPLITPSNAADIIGSFESFLVETDQYEDEEGTPFWQIAPKLILKTHNSQASLVRYNYPLVSAAVKANVSARLDDSVTFSVPHFEQMKRRNESLATVALSHRKDSRLKDVRGIEQGFLHEQSDRFIEGGRMVQRIRRLANRLSEAPDPVVLEALRQQLLSRKVHMVGDIQLGIARVEGHYTAGTVADVFEAELPDGKRELVAALAKDDAENDQQRAEAVSQLVILRTLESLQF